MNPNATTGSMVQFVVMMVVLFAIMYFMIIRPFKTDNQQAVEVFFEKCFSFNKSIFF